METTCLYQPHFLFPFIAAMFHTKRCTWPPCKCIDGSGGGETIFRFRVTATSCECYWRSANASSEVLWSASNTSKKMNRSVAQIIWSHVKQNCLSGNEHASADGVRNLSESSPLNDQASSSPPTTQHMFLEIDSISGESLLRAPWLWRCRETHNGVL